MKRILLVLFICFLAGCAMTGRTIQTGMTTEEVKSQWGSPWSTLRSYEADREIEVWQYGLGQYAVKTWLVFDNGKLTRIIRKGG